MGFSKYSITYWSIEEVTQSSQEISQLCDKPITPVAMYKAIIKEGDSKVVSWINADNKILVCSITDGKSSQSDIQTDSPTSSPTKSATTIPTTTSNVGYISALSNPVGGGIYVDGIYKGIADGNHIEYSVTTGYHDVKITYAGYETFSKSVSVSSGQSVTVTVNFIGHRLRD